MTIKEALFWARKRLLKACERPIHEDDVVDDLKGYEILVDRRAAHEPYEYIVGSASFYDIYLEVESGVLIPRPETEILIDLVTDIIEKEQIRKIAEIGVGSGAISIVLARKFPELKIIATDICDTPIKVAGKNIGRFGLSGQIELRRSNLIDEVTEPVELVVSNPPYIAEDCLLESNVIDYEPQEALFGGSVGDELLKQIISDVKARGIKWLACEMGYDQKKPILEFVNKIGVESIEFYRDLAGLDRGFIIKFL